MSKVNLALAGCVVWGVVAGASLVNFWNTGDPLALGVFIVAVVMMLVSITLTDHLRNKEWWSTRDRDGQKEVDFDREFIPMNDSTDPTSLILSLTMHGYRAHMGYDEANYVWVLTVLDKDRDHVFEGDTQLEVLQQATRELNVPR